MKINRLLYVAVVFISIITVSCEQTELKKQEIEVQDDVFASGGRLVFENSIVMTETLELVNNQSELEKKSWLSKHNYKPLSNIVEAIKSRNERRYEINGELWARVF